jgi:hypothetical protein
MECYYSPLKGTDWSTLFKNWNRSYFEKRESRSGWKVWQISIPLEMLISSSYNIGCLKINDTRMTRQAILCFVDRTSCVSLWIVNQLDALIFSNIFICLPLSTCFGHYVPIIRRDPIALTQLLYLSFRFSCVSYEH